MKEEVSEENQMQDKKQEEKENGCNPEPLWTLWRRENGSYVLTADYHHAVHHVGLPSMEVYQ